MTNHKNLLTVASGKLHGGLWPERTPKSYAKSFNDRVRSLLYMDSLIIDIQKSQLTEIDTLNRLKEDLNLLYRNEFGKKDKQVLVDLNHLNSNNTKVTDLKDVTPDLWHRYFLQQLEQIKAEINKLPNDENKACLLAALVLYEGHLEVRYAEDIKKAAIEKALLSLEGRKTLDFNKGEEGRTPAQRRQDTIDAIFNAYQNNPQEPKINELAAIRNLSTKAQAQVKLTLDKSLKVLEPFAAYGEISLDNRLVDKLNHTITEHLSFKRGQFTPQESRFIKELKAVINQSPTPNNLSQQIKRYFDDNTPFSHDGYSSRLERHMKRTLARHASERRQDDTVSLRVKVWGKSEDRETLLQAMRDPGAIDVSVLDKKPLKVVLMVHGLQDSVDTFNEMAKQYVARGYTVISYDHAGHGFDPRRRSGSQLKLAQIQADFYGVVDKLYGCKQVASIDIVAHSMGSALVAQSIGFLEARNGVSPQAPQNSGSDPRLFSRQQTDPAPSAPPKITSVKLFAQPYISFWDVLKNLRQYLKDPSDMSADVKDARSQGVSRIGGPKPSFAFFQFLKQGYEALKHYQQQGTQTLQVEVHVSTQDKVAPAEKIMTLFGQESSRTVGKKAVELVTHEGEGHHFHYNAPDLVAPDRVPAALVPKSP